MIQDLTDLLRWMIPAVALVFAVGWLIANWSKLDQAKDAGSKEFDVCKSCGYDIRGKLERCPECGAVTPYVRRRKLKELREKLPHDAIDRRSPDPHEQPVVVFTTDQGMLAEILQQHLDARGISARVERAKPVNSVLPGRAILGAKLVVWSDDQERAKAILKSVWQEEDAD